VAWKIYENAGGPARPKPTDATPGDYMTYSVDINGPTRGIGPNAGDWDRTAPALGIPVNTTPTVGSAAQWFNNGDGGRFKVGHVGMVTAVFPDGSIDIAQYNLLEDHEYSTMYLPRDGTTFAGLPVSWPDRFVHVKGF
jgi:surface antigen